MELVKGIVKVVLALVALGTGAELGKRGIDNIKKGLPEKKQ